MAFELTNNALGKSQENSIEPNLVLKIDGVTECFSAIPILQFVKIGDPDLEIGDPDVNANAFFIGGFNLAPNQSNFITFDGTSTTIRQQLQQDRGIGGSISTFNVALIDKDEEITQLITPDDTVSPTFDVLGRKCKIFLGFDETAFPDDYITIFRGVITDIVSIPGKVTFTINHPDNKKRASLYKEFNTQLDGAIDATTTTIVFDETTDLLSPITGPDLTIDPSFESFVRIDDEIIQFTGTTATTITGVTRGALGTTGASHSDEADVKSFYRLQGNSMDLALKLMLSGFNDNFIEDEELESFNIISPTLTVDNAIFFKETNVLDVYGLTVGDFITTIGAANAANNVTLKVIDGIVETDDGDYITISGVTFVDETSSAATISFRSQYDTLADGMRMSPDEVDVDEHERLKRLFLSSFDYDFFLKETVDGKEFLEEQIYSPIAAYSLPRKSRASAGYHIGPIPGQKTPILSDINVKRADQIKLKRGTSRNFFNEILYRFEEDVLEDRFLAGRITISQTSKDRILGAPKSLNIDSKGLRRSLLGASIALSQSNRRLDRYKFGAESISIEVLYKIGFNVEIGDIIIFEGKNLKVTDITRGDREFKSRLMEVQNKTFNIKSGKIKLDLIDTNFLGQGRYALIGPSSQIKSASSTTQFIIEESFNSPFGQNEFQKWENFTLPVVKVHNADFSNDDTSVIQSFSGNLVTISPALSFTPAVGDIMELSNYDDPITTTDQIKLLYGHMQDSATFGDGEPQYIML